MSLALLKSETLAVLADAYDETAWSDATLEEALRQALLFFHAYAEIREATFTLLESGYEHDLATLKAHDILAIAWPWENDGGYCFEDVTRPWRMVGDNVIRMDSLYIEAGEDVRIQYRPRHTIQYLDGATTTTFWPVEQQRFTLAAARFALLLRSVYFAHYGVEEQRLAIPALTGAADIMLQRFLDYRQPQQGSSSFITWGGLGL